MHELWPRRNHTAIAVQLFNLGKQMRIGLAAVEQCQRMTACERGLDEMLAKKSGATEDQQFHQMILAAELRGF
jgi:hypothetical protein